MNIARSWEILEAILSDFDSSERKWKSVVPCPELKEAAYFLGSPGMSQLLEEWLHETILEDLSKRVSPVFWKHFQNLDNESNEPDKSGETFAKAFGFLYDVYSDYYMVAWSRLRWLQILAASAPTVGPSGSTSAFTPVKPAGVSFSKSVKIGACEKVHGGLKSERAGRPEIGQLSVTFEKGTKGEDMETDFNDLYLEESTCKFGLGSNLEKRMAVSMDGSYVNCKTNDDSVLSDVSGQRSYQNSQSLNVSRTDPVVKILEEEEDFESFIRSPIGGNKKLMSSTVKMKTAFPLSSGEAVKTCVDSSSGTKLHPLSLTSTPGTAQKQTPGPVTPIAYQESPDVFSDISIQKTLGDLSHLDSPSILEASVPADVFDAGNSDALPNASVVFGVPVSSRPVPGGSVRWPSNDKGTGGMQNRVQLMIKSVLLYTFPKTFATVVKNFYSHAFTIHRNQMEGTESEKDIEVCQKRFDDVNKKLDEMGLMELVSGSAVTEIVHSQIEKHIEDECKGNFDSSYLSELEEWLDQQVLGWLNHLYACKQTASQLASVVAFRDRLRHFIYETYAKSLIGQFFDIIIDYPDSKPAILDLSACLEKTDLRSELVSTLKHALENRLLHPGVNTADILTAYIAAIKSLRLLEPAGVILELVCEPVGRYLRSREDTVRCIVASLTDEGNNELINELVNTKPVGEENQEEDGNMVGWENWMPDPVDADPSTLSKNRRSADILSTLVNIYGSKELFVNEYRALLADRILMQYNYDVERELRYLELLKLRFGEAQLHFCEVMLRDVTESRRVNARIQDARKLTETPEEVEMNAMILSAQFWPAFRDEKITLPPDLQEHLDKYTKSFETQKQNRTLVWKPHLGIMNIELELKEETLSFSVSPVQAAIIMKFQTKSKWSVDELSSELEMTASVLRRKIAFWQGQGLLREISPDMYQLVEERRGRPHDLVMIDEEEIESAMASAQQQKEEEMQVFWTYIQGMLQNLDCLTLERIHSMLRMFAMEEPSSSEVSPQELKTFLDNKVKDQVLIFSGGVYRLNK
ncbi:anaphase-promoting complex subunit 2-like isoform X2 [Physella acuta]|uniref:anaphase-promoting complex subunit 2-like isoform X2 n=1 Tax=Physella acuta TaxID=109671 RepID=UPI0027DBC771|nr:anaphase-promoting complex subunit 2-like isoform X2 [Physella acuta]